MVKATVGELQMGFLVSKGSQAVSSYEMFVKWMDKIVSNSFARRIILRRSLCELKTENHRPRCRQRMDILERRGDNECEDRYRSHGLLRDTYLAVRFG